MWCKYFNAICISLSCDTDCIPGLALGLRIWEEGFPLPFPPKHFGQDLVQRGDLDKMQTKKSTFSQVFQQVQDIPAHSIKTCRIIEKSENRPVLLPNPSTDLYLKKIMTTVLRI